MTHIDYGPDVPVEQYEAALAESKARLRGDLERGRANGELIPAPSPADMPKKRRKK